MRLAFVFLCLVFPVMANVVSGKLVINQRTSGTFSVGQAWNLQLTEGQASVQPNICATYENRFIGCSPTNGRTNTQGGWTAQGVFPAAVVGRWSEWLEYPNGEMSNRISFTVNASGLGRFTLNGEQGGVYNYGQKWTMLYTGGLANAPFALCSQRAHEPVNCVPNFGRTDASGSFTRSGEFTGDVMGGWTEWLDFAPGVTSNPIAFSVKLENIHPIPGLVFSPYYSWQVKDGKLPKVSEDFLRLRLGIVAPFTQWVRVTTCGNGMDAVGRLAHTRNLKVALGADITDNLANNESELQCLINAGLRGEADVLVVGENTDRSDQGMKRLYEYLTRVKKAVPQLPVTTVIDFYTLEKNPNIQTICDVFYVSSYDPLPQGNVDETIRDFIRYDQEFRTNGTVFKNKEVVFASIGWPTRSGDIRRPLVDSTDKASVFFQAFTGWARMNNRKFFYSEAFDQPWRLTGLLLTYPPTEVKYQGLWTEDGVMKGELVLPFLHASLDPIGGPGKPILTYTQPPDGSTAWVSGGGRIYGKVQHVLPFTHYIALYIKVGGGWWTKPFWNSPKTYINLDGSWFNYVETGGIDDTATEVVAYLLPNGFDVPLMYGGGTLPPELEQSAVAKAVVTRSVASR